MNSDFGWLLIGALIVSGLICFFGVGFLFTNRRSKWGARMTAFGAAGAVTFLGMLIAVITMNATLFIGACFPGIAVGIGIEKMIMRRQRRQMRFARVGV